ncbi:putative sodium-coupled neutral amino acid transporter 11 [Trichonephila clavata]|uniref:Putative sodium-coupled neutral amino acid transporter 11 n=1 Tax=Trichonephila clavata TaxID=2740835 RepID=A0A8X6KLX1_TRICU|nr:putative sodium-coupled neutral amino acid transporter 11 [Trichonephila clavata]
MATENTYILYESHGGKSQQETNDSVGSTEDIKQLIIADGPREVKSNLAETSFNYINSVIGSGIVGIPYALQQAGLGMGIILLLLIAVATDYSLCIMIKAGTAAGVTTYQALIQSQFGKPGYYFLTVAQFIYPLIAMISYNIIIGDTITKVLMRMFDVSRNSLLGNRHFIVFLCTLFVTLPLSLYRTIVRLSLVSFLSLVFAASIVIFVVIRSITMVGLVVPSSDGMVFANTGFTEAVGVIAFAYMCHHNSFLLFDVLDNPTQSRWNLVTHISISFSCLIIVVFGICGYVTFTGSVQGDLLENFCMNDDWANAARLIFTITIMLTFPIECFVTREVFENAVFKEKQSSLLRHSILTVSLVFVTFALSTLTDCLSIVLELNGVLAAVPLAYILPAAAYIRVTGGPYFTFEKAPAILLATSGFLIAMIGTVKSVLDMIQGVKCSHGAEMNYCIQNYTSLHNVSTY